MTDTEKSVDVTKTNSEQLVNVSPNSEQINKAFRGLFDIMKKIIEHREKMKMKLSSEPNPVYLRLIKFIKAYEYCEPSDFFCYFQNIFTKYREIILSGHKNDQWLKTGNISITLGDGISEVVPRDDIKIMLSAIYNNACQLKNETEKKLEEIGDDDDWENSKELIYPQVMMLHLYRVFRESVENTQDKQKLSKLVSDIENELGLTTNTTTVSQPVMAPFENIMNQMFSSLKGNQMEQNSSNNLDIFKIVTNVLNNPQIQNTMNKLMSDLQESQSTDQAIQKLLQGFNNPELTSAIVKSLNFPSTEEKSNDTPPKLEETD